MGFIVLKLIGVITWSWWMVFLPLIIVVGFYLIILVIALIVWLVAAIKIRKGIKKMDSFWED